MSMFGFVGGLALFFTFMLLLWRMLRVVNISPDTFGQQIAAGMTTMIFLQTFVNIGMNLGLLPVTGITLPFISLGGTSLFGGRGRVIGTLYGALIVGVLRNGLTLTGVDVLWQDFAVGILIIAAVAIDQWIRKISG